MASIAEVSVTVLPSEPVDTTSFYKNVLRPALAAVGLQRADPRLPHRMVPAYPPFGAFGFTAYGIRSPRCSLSAGVHFMQVSKWLGHSSYVLTLSIYADYIREDDTAAPNFTRPVATAIDNVVDLERRKSGTA